MASAPDSAVQICGRTPAATVAIGRLDAARAGSSDGFINHGHAGRHRPRGDHGAHHTDVWRVSGTPSKPTCVFCNTLCSICHTNQLTHGSDDFELTPPKRSRSLASQGHSGLCIEAVGDQDRFYIRQQQTNAYAILPATGWRGFCPPCDEPPAPHPDTWGKPPPMPSILAAAAMERRAGGTLKETIQVLELGPVNGLEAALARLGRAVLTREK
jgi:hypothetical protein